MRSLTRPPQRPRLLSRLPTRVLNRLHQLWRLQPCRPQFPNLATIKTERGGGARNLARLHRLQAQQGPRLGLLALRWWMMPAPGAGGGLRRPQHPPHTQPPGATVALCHRGNFLEGSPSQVESRSDEAHLCLPLRPARRDRNNYVLLNLKRKRYARGPALRGSLLRKQVS